MLGHTGGLEPDQEPRYWVQDVDRLTNVPDLLRSIANGEMVAVVDEEAGGIIAYTMSEENAQRIRAALEAHS